MLTSIITIFDRLSQEGGLLRVRAILAIGMTIAACAMYVSQIPVPQEFVGLWGLSVGFYYMSRGGK